MSAYKLKKKCCDLVVGVFMNPNTVVSFLVSRDI